MQTTEYPPLAFRVHSLACQVAVSAIFNDVSIAAGACLNVFASLYLLQKASIDFKEK